MIARRVKDTRDARLVTTDETDKTVNRNEGWVPSAAASWITKSATCWPR